MALNKNRKVTLACLCILEAFEDKDDTMRVKKATNKEGLN